MPASRTSARVAPGRIATATAAATAAAPSWQNPTLPVWIMLASSWAWADAARGWPALTMPTGAIAIAELELGMFPSLSSRGG